MLLCHKIITSQNNLKLKVRTEFSNVWGEYKYHGNPYIQGTTVPCDIHVPSLCMFHTLYIHTKWGGLPLCINP